VDVIPFQKDRIDIAPTYNDPTGDYLTPEHFTQEDVKDAKIALFGGYSYYGKHWHENLEKLTSLVEAEPEKKRPLLVMSFSSTDIAGRPDFREALTASLRRTPGMLSGNMDELALFLGVEPGPKLLPKAQEFLKKIEQETGIKNEMFITNGKQGSCAVTTEGIQNFLSMHVPKDKIVETNGAGAAALGGYLYGRAHDLTRGESATLSQAFSAAVIQQHEGQISPERTHTYKFWGKSITATGPLATLPPTDESFKILTKLDAKARELQT
jgi:sugar/nucleoside kinase (ribokinase family)